MCRWSWLLLTVLLLIKKAVKHIQMLLDDNSGIFDAKGQQLFYGDFRICKVCSKKTLMLCMMMF